MKLKISTFITALAAFGLWASDEPPFEQPKSLRSLDTFQTSAESAYEKLDYTGYHYLSLGTSTQTFVNLVTDNRQASVFSLSSTGIGKRFLFGSHHGGLVEVNGGALPNHYSIFSAKAGYNYRFISGFDRSTPYIGFNQHVGALRLHKGFKSHLEHYEGRKLSALRPYYSSQLALGYEFKDGNKAPIFIELTNPLLTKSISLSLGFGF